ncbi:MAG: HAD family hydrolase [Acidobacteriaceae bacterium]|nr:HAD family hydrolase [Acidobacteriaceae bacterium]
MNRKPQLIAVDMDGTLLGSDGKVSTGNMAALRAAHAARVEVVVATGRRHSFAMQALRACNLPGKNALISSNGTVIRTVDAALIHRSHMSAEAARWLVQHSNEFRSSMVFTFDCVGTNGDDQQGALVAEHGHDLDGNIGRWMEANRAYFANVNRLEDAFDGNVGDPIQAMLCGTPERMDEALKHLLQSKRVVLWEGEQNAPEAEIVLHRTEYREKNLIIVDILPAGCSKASALEKLVALRGLSMADVLAIGDNWNDVPMLEAAGQAIVMSNAPETLLKMANDRGWSLAPTNDEDGVAWAIEQALAAEPALTR